tara:strand:- start:688 stop:1218 length:531 start_codon:yes stop_codon:yes gene_type:complete
MSSYIDDKSCTSSAEFAVILAPIAKRIVLCDMRPSKVVSEDGKVTEVKGELVPKCYGGQGAKNQAKFDIFAADRPRFSNNAESLLEACKAACRAAANKGVLLDANDFYFYKDWHDKTAKNKGVTPAAVESLLKKIDVNSLVVGKTGRYVSLKGYPEGQAPSAVKSDFADLEDLDFS